MYNRLKNILYLQRFTPLERDINRTELLKYLPSFGGYF